MNRKVNVLFIVFILIVALVVLTGCNKGETAVEQEEEISSSELEMHILALELEKNKFIQVRVDYPQDKEINLKENEKEPNKVTITNKKKGYELKLALEDELEDAYYDKQETDKNEKEYSAVKFAENDGYYYLSGKSTIIGNVLIDTQTDKDYKYVHFEMSSVKGNSDLLSIFNQQEVQNILSSFGFRYTTGNTENSNVESGSSEDVLGQWAHLSYVYTFNSDGTGTYDAMGTIMNFTYEADGKQLSILYTGNTSPTVLKYKLDGNKLIVTDSFGEDVVYVKK